MAGNEAIAALTRRRTRFTGLSPVIEIVPYDPAWPERFAWLGGELRRALGGVALRIDHIGSTAVPALPPSR